MFFSSNSGAFRSLAPRLSSILNSNFQLNKSMQSQSHITQFCDEWNFGIMLVEDQNLSGFISPWAMWYLCNISSPAEISRVWIDAWCPSDFAYREIHPITTLRPLQIAQEEEFQGLDNHGPRIWDSQSFYCFVSPDGRGQEYPTLSSSCDSDTCDVQWDQILSILSETGWLYPLADEPF